jgi:CRISPR system Cascade subunit CasE
MYLTKIITQSGFPSKSLIRDLCSPYEMHRTVRKAFPQDDKERYLFRLDNQIILVQSMTKPDWSFLQADYAENVQTKQIDFKFKDGQKLKFKLRANPVKCVHDKKGKSKRLGILDDDNQMEWLIKKGEKSGFKILTIRVAGSKMVKIRQPKKITYVMADFEGVLEITDAILFQQTVRLGIGSEKSMGNGLLLFATV